MIKKTFKFLGICAISLLLIIGVCLLLLQTNQGKERVRSWIFELAAKENIELSIETIKGSLPLKWELSNVHIKTPDGITIDIEHAKVRIAIFPLLYRELRLSYLAAYQARITLPDAFTPSFDELKSHPESLVLPLSFSVKTIKIPSLTIVQGEKSLTIAFEGNGGITRHLERFTANVKIVPLAFPLSFVDCSLHGNAMIKRIGIKCTARATSANLLAPFVSLPFETDCLVQSQLEGSWDTWMSLFDPTTTRASSTPLKGAFKALVNTLDLSDHPFLNRKWKVATSFLLAADTSLTVSKLQLSSDLISLSAQAKIDAHYDLRQGNFSFYLPQIALFELDVPIQGALKGNVCYEDQAASVKLSSGNLRIAEELYPHFETQLQATKKDASWEGHGEVALGQEEFYAKASSDFALTTQNSIALKDLTICAPYTQLNGNLLFNFESRSLEGALFAQSSNLKPFQKWFGGSGLQGNVGLEAHFKPESNEQVKLHVRVHDFAYKKFSAEEMTLDAELLGLFSDREGKITLDAQKARIASLFLSQLHATTHSGSGKWPFVFQAKGMWEDGLDVKSSGSWMHHQDELSVEFSELTGFMFKKPFALKKPFFLNLEPDRIKISDWEMRLAEGGFSLELEMSKMRSAGYIKAEHFPLELFLISHPTLSFTGSTSIDARFEATPTKLEGHANLLLEQATGMQMGKSEALKAKGYLQAHLNQQNLQLHAGLKASRDQYLEWTATIPMQYSASPFQLKANENLPFSSELTMDGKLEEIFDFINVGSHQIKGQLITHLLASKTLAAPAFQGTIELRDGVYENYRTGTYLQAIQGRAIAEKDELQIVALSGKDSKDGTIGVQGTVDLKPQKLFPYFITAQLDDLNAIRFDTIRSNLSGSLELSGTTKGAMATGNLTVSKGELEISDDLPPEIPVLPVTYLNQPEGFDRAEVAPLSLFPFGFDLNITAPATTPGSVIVRGRGLRSEWQGDVHLLGTNADVALSGTLNLLRGEFAFAGKVFTLNQGEIVIVDRPKQHANINLSGTLQLADVLITVLLSGPIDSPHLTFQSSPHLPTSSILAKILFNKDITEISPVQAIQLAQTIMTMAGSAGPDVLEKIRKSLGVDRLNIVSSPTSRNADEISVQIGKYLTRGVMVTLSQSADSSNIIVEVELKKGFIFQAETQEEQQGKFTLKWNRNY